MVSPLCVVLAVALAASAPAPRQGRKAHATGRATSAPRTASLAEARAELRAVQRDPEKRRYRDRWEHAIRGLERAARGKDRAPALLDAARGRYALYRFSQVEADRDAALALAAKARRAGSREAAAFVAAVRREAGVADAKPSRKAAPARGSSAAPTPAPDRDHGPYAPSVAPPKAARSRRAATPTAGTRTAGPRPGPDAFDEPPSTDPVLDRILAQLAHEPETGPAAPAPAAALPAPAPTAPLASAPPSGASTPAPVAAAPGAPAAVSADPALEKILEELRASPRAAAREHEDRGPIRRVVLDPGHGGHDSGAVGPRGVQEKVVALQIARRLARRLRAAGLEVVLTRDDDRYLALHERAAIANRSRGDLFVSLHANAHPRRDRAGVETYVLDVAHDRYAKRLAARENGVLDGEGAEALPDAPEVRRVLSDLDAKASAAPSRRLAEAVQRELTEGIRARFGEVRDLGVKSALFYVLLGARMPAVLVETSFISNRVEERRLASARFQDEVAASIARAVAGFAAGEARVARR